MAPKPSSPTYKPPPEIDCSKEYDLAREDQDNRPEQRHKFEKASADAIRAALGARRPLLVRGLPGVGKTQLAEAAAKVLKRPLVRRVVDARTEARDLLWEFDAVMRLAEAQIASARVPRADSRGESDQGPAAEAHRDQREADRSLEERLSVGRFLRPGPLWWAFDWEGAYAQAKRSGSPVPSLDAEADPQNGCVVLIDEIDKADIDVPNGLLEALGSGEFTPFGSSEPVRVTGEPPLVIITTNEERVLPNAFVRRCLVLRLKLPDNDDELVEFLKARARVHFPKQAKSGKHEELFETAARTLLRDRKSAREQRAEPLPGQAEYLDLLRAIFHLESDSIARQKQILDSVAEFALRKYEAP
jgi:MoxR-like ATPase